MEVHLRKLELKDAPRMLEWMHDDEVTKHLRLHGNNATIETVQAFIQKSYVDEENVHWAVVNQDDLYLGTVSLKNIDNDKKEAELAIVLHGDTIGHGIGGKAIELLLKQTKEESTLERIYLNVLEENQRAEKLYIKLGFQYLSTTDEDINGDVKKMNWYEYSLKN